METLETIITDRMISKKWWAERRLNYNIGLIVAGILAFLAFAILGEWLIVPYDHQFEITGFTMIFQGVGYLIMMGIANLFYNLGHFVDVHYNKDNSEIFRRRLFNLGFWFSVALPFLIPIIIVMQYFAYYSNGYHGAA